METREERRLLCCAKRRRSPLADKRTRWGPAPTGMEWVTPAEKAAGQLSAEKLARVVDKYERVEHVRVDLSLIHI